MEKNKDRGGMTVREAGKRGGQKTSREHGPEFYHEIGTKGGRRVRELIEQGKMAEQKIDDMRNRESDYIE
jgi:general stress protein YciG